MKQPEPNANLIPTPYLYPTCPEYFADVVLQEGNTHPQTKIQPKKSSQLEDNGSGGDVGNWESGTGVYRDLLRHIEDLGLKWVRTNFWSPNPLNWQEVLVAPGEHRIPLDCDNFITALANRGVNIVLTLSAGAGLDGSEHSGGVPRDTDYWGNGSRHGGSKRRRSRSSLPTTHGLWLNTSTVECNTMKSGTNPLRTREATHAHQLR